MNEELNRIVEGLFNGAELDSYDKDLIRRIIIEQHEEIERLSAHNLDLALDYAHLKTQK